MGKHIIKNEKNRQVFLGITINSSLYNYLTKISNDIDKSKSKIVEEILYKQLKKYVKVVNPDLENNPFEKK